MRSVYEASRVAYTVLQEVKQGRKKRIRANTAKAILEVDFGAAADCSLVDGEETHRLISKMVKWGYTKTELSRRLGCKAKTPTLQLKRRRVTLKSAHKVKKLFKEIKAEVKEVKEYRPICTSCGYSHAKKDRLVRLKRLLPTTAEIIREVWTCCYGGIAGERALYRDFQYLGAWADEGTWRLT